MKVLDIRENCSDPKVVKIIWGVEDEYIIFDPDSTFSSIYSPDNDAEVRITEEEIDDLISALGELKKLYESQE